MQNCIRWSAPLPAATPPSFSRPEGLQFTVSVHDLSGAPVGVHLHAPATAAQAAPVVLTLCGNPAPAAVACAFDTNTNSMLIQGMVSPGLLQAWGPAGAQLYDWFDAGLAYVNVHTALNPMGEVRSRMEGE